MSVNGKKEETEIVMCILNIQPWESSLQNRTYFPRSYGQNQQKSNLMNLMLEFVCCSSYILLPFMFKNLDLWVCLFFITTISVGSHWLQSRGRYVLVMMKKRRRFLKMVSDSFFFSMEGMSAQSDWPNTSVCRIWLVNFYALGSFDFGMFLAIFKQAGVTTWMSD